MDDDMVIKGPTGQSFFLRITRPTAKTAVIWLEEKKLREKWFCNVRFGQGSFCTTDSNPFASMPHTLLGIIQDAFEADGGGKFRKSSAFTVSAPSPFYMELHLTAKIAGKDYSWAFPLSPDDPVAVAMRVNGRAIIG